MRAHDSVLLLPDTGPRLLAGKPEKRPEIAFQGGDSCVQRWKEAREELFTLRGTEAGVVVTSQESVKRTAGPAHRAGIESSSLVSFCSSQCWGPNPEPWAC